MSIAPVAPPQSVVDKASKYVASLAVIPGDHFLSSSAGEDIHLVAPHRVYALPFNAIRRADLSGATFVSWRFLIVAGEQIVGWADVHDDADQSVAVGAGPFVSATANAIDELESLPGVQTSDVEMRILSVNALYLLATWLVGEDQQIIIPLAPAPSFVQAGKRYTEQSLLEALNQPGVRPFAVGGEYADD